MDLYIRGGVGANGGSRTSSEFRLGWGVRSQPYTIQQWFLW